MYLCMCVCVYFLRRGGHLDERRNTPKHNNVFTHKIANLRYRSNIQRNLET